MDLRVVLVGPENPLNVGFVARAMRAFGAKDLVVAGSAWKTLPAEARVTGVSAPEVLDGVRFEKELSGALRGCDTAIAFSRRPTDLRQDEFTLPAIPASLNLGVRTALVFGRESKGLTRAETALCPYLARIPCENGVSLNLGQAVAVALFSLTATDRTATDRTATDRTATDRTATDRTATDGVLPRRAATASLERMTAMWEFIHPKLAASPRLSEEREQRIRQMLFRLRLNDDDFDMLFSVMKALSK